MARFVQVLLAAMGIGLAGALTGCAISPVQKPLTGAKERWGGASPSSPSPKSGHGTRHEATSKKTAERMEKEILQRINDIRVRRGLKALQPNDKLTQSARAYCRKMDVEKFFDHTSPSGVTMVDRMRAAHIDYSMVGENLFQCVNVPDPVTVAVQGWMRSPGHRENILNPSFTESGVGVYARGDTVLVSQLFRRPPIF